MTPTEEAWAQEDVNEYVDDGAMGAFWAGECKWLSRDLMDVEAAESYLEEESLADPQMLEVYAGFKEARDALNQLLRRSGFCSVVAIPAADARLAHLAAKGEGPPRRRFWKRRQEGQRSITGKGPGTGIRNGHSKNAPPGPRVQGGSLVRSPESQTQCRRCGETCHWQAHCLQNEAETKRSRGARPRASAARRHPTRTSRRRCGASSRGPPSR